MPRQWFCKQKQTWFFRIAEQGRATQNWRWQKMPDFDPNKVKFYGEKLELPATRGPLPVKETAD
eukprot:1944466-Prymnesium_polylepis.1